MRSVLFGYCVAMALGCGAATSATDEKKAAEKSAAKPATAEVTVKVLSFAEFEALVASHKGKVVVVDCWSTS